MNTSITQPECIIAIYKVDTLGKFLNIIKCDRCY